MKERHPSDQQGEKRQLGNPHGVTMAMHGGGAKLRIAIELERNAGTLVASIEDSGREFDPTQFPPPSVAKSLEEAKVGDLGIHLMHSFASDMRYGRRDGRNRLTLRFVELH